MRLLIKLESKVDTPYENQYHFHLQSFIYSLLKGSKYSYLHDKKGYKFFCFSNIFPVSDKILKNDIRNLIISSPDIEFIELVDSMLNKNNSIMLGNMDFTIVAKQKILPKIRKNIPFKLITGTPIIIRIPSKKFNEYDYVPEKQYSYIYWRKNHPIQLFISQLENNLLRKYSEFNSMIKYQNSILHQNIGLFERFRFKKQISTRIMTNKRLHIVIGTTWEFEFEGWENAKLINFILDAGLGERNSMGFGFINLITN